MDVSKPYRVNISSCVRNRELFGDIDKAKIPSIKKKRVYQLTEDDIDCRTEFCEIITTYNKWVS